jgi:hypothetical protein
MASSNRFPRIQSALGGDDRSRRRSPADADQEWHPPQEVSDPHTLDDETHQSLLERLQSNWIPFVTISVGLIVAVVLVVVYGGTYFATVASNIWVQRAVVALGLVAGSYVLGFQSGQQSIAKHDELTLYNPDDDETLTFLGELSHAREGDHPVFTPYKGLRGLFGSPERYAGDELTPSLAPGIPAKIRLHPSMSGRSPTSWGGQKAVQTTNGLRPDPRGSETNVVATLPSQAAESTVTDLTDQVESLNREITTLRKMVNTLKRQRDDALDAAEKPREEIREEIKEYRDLFAPFATRSRYTGGDGTDDADEIADMADELMGDGEDAR